MAIQRQPAEHMIAVEPSEAVTSQDIAPLIEPFSTIIRRIDYGGGDHQSSSRGRHLHFGEQRPADMAILDMILCFEQLLIQKRVLESDFTKIVAAKERSAVKAQGLSDPTAPRRKVG